MRVGSVRSVTAIYESTLLLHVSLDDILVITYVADAGANAGALRCVPDGLRDVLRPLADVVAMRAH